jgi:hypothetical protein
VKWKPQYSSGSVGHGRPEATQKVLMASINARTNTRGDGLSSFSFVGLIYVYLFIF